MVMDVKRYFFTEDQNAVEKSLPPAAFLRSFRGVLPDILEFFVDIISSFW